MLKIFGKVYHVLKIKVINCRARENIPQHNKIISIFKSTL